MFYTFYRQWRSQYRGKGAECPPPLTAKKIVKKRGKSGKTEEKSEKKSRKKRKNREEKAKIGKVISLWAMRFEFATKIVGFVAFFQTASH